MKTWNKIILKWIDCDGTKVYCCRLCREDSTYGVVEPVIDHIEKHHNEIYLEYKNELARIDIRIELI